MASTVALLIPLSPNAQIRYSPSSSAPRRTTTNKTLNVFTSRSSNKSRKILHFLFSSSFPITIKTFPPNPIQFYPLQDFVHDNFLQNLESSTNFLIPPEIIHQRVENIENSIDLCTQRKESEELFYLEPRRRVFIQDPPWIFAMLLKGLYKRIKQQEGKLKLEKRKFNFLRSRQVKENTEAWERMVDEYRDLEAKMIEKKLAPNLPLIKGAVFGVV